MIITFPAGTARSTFHALMAVMFGVCGSVGVSFGWLVLTGSLPPIAATLLGGGLTSILAWLFITSRIRFGEAAP